MSVAEQRYQAVLAVIAQGRSVTEVAAQWEVSRQTLHAWLARYEVEGLEGLGDRSHRPVRCPHQMPAALQARVLEMRRANPFWGPRRIVAQLCRAGVDPLPSESGVYRCLVRAGLIAPVRRARRSEAFRRWERAAPMELWQMDVVGGFHLADGTSAKALTGIDDYSRFCVSAWLMPRERTQAVCDGLATAMRAHGVPQQILTDNGKVFTGRFHTPPVEVLFDRDLPGERLRSPADRTPVPDHHREGRAVPPHPAARVRHHPSVPVAGGGPGSTAGVGRLLTPPAHTRPWTTRSLRTASTGHARRDRGCPHSHRSGSRPLARNGSRARSR
jgi:transposase